MVKNYLKFNIFLLLFISVLTTQSEAEERLKIGLVLGGGGARGAAHVGVLKVLEENNVPVDFVIGTSMGSIVGGLYSSGMSPEEIEKTIKNIDWVDIFQDRPSEEYLSFRNKKDQQRLTAIEMGIKDGGLRLPRGVVAGQKLGFELKKLTLPVAHLTDFDKLSIPFRAVATDLRSGDVVVRKNGSLSDAIRASMSIPGVFPPVEIDGRLLVDGFVVNNVPVEIAKQLGADIIIAVDVGGPPAQDAKFENLLDVSSQLLALLSQQNVDKSLALLTDKDLLIQPELGDIKPDSFTRAPEAIKLGEETARKFVEQIKRYSVSDTEYHQFLAKQRRKESEPPVIDFIRVAGPNRASEKAILGRINTKPGEKLNLDKLQQDLTRVYSINDFETVEFKVVEEDGKTGLLIDPLDKSWGPNYLRFGLNLSNDTSGDSEYSVLADYRMTQLNNLGAEWRNVVEFGESYGILTEFYQPLDNQDYFFVSPFFKYNRELGDVYQDDNLTAEYEKRYLGGGVGLGVNVRSYAQARVDYLIGTVDAEPKIGGTTLPEFDNVKEGALKFTLDYDQLDNHKFPKEGIRSVNTFYASSESFGGDFSYEKLDLKLAKATTIARRHTLISSVNFGMTMDEDAPFYDQFLLGGFLNLSGYGERQLRGQHKGLAQLLYYYKFSKDPFGSGGHLYLGGGVEYGNVWDDLDDMDIGDSIFSGLVFVGVDSPLGPLYFGYAKGEGGPDGRIYLFLGKTF